MLSDEYFIADPSAATREVDQAAEHDCGCNERCDRCRAQGGGGLSLRGMQRECATVWNSEASAFVGVGAGGEHRGGDEGDDAIHAAFDPSEPRDFNDVVS